MYKVIVENKLDNRKFEAKFESMEEVNIWIQKQSNKSSKPWGLPERKINIKDASELDKQRSIRVEEELIEDKIIEFLIVPSDFNLRIINEQEDNSFFNAEQKKRRSKAYPSWNKINEALLENMEGRPELLEKVMSEREIIRNQYPYRK